MIETIRLELRQRHIGAAQLSGINVSGNKATFTYYAGCLPGLQQRSGHDLAVHLRDAVHRISTTSSLVYASAISCPPSGGATSITVTWPATIPVSSGVRFKYEGYGQGHFIAAAPGSAYAGEREASESGYAGPSALGPH